MKKIIFLLATVPFFMNSCSISTTEKNTTTVDSTAAKNSVGKPFEVGTPTTASAVVAKVRDGKEFKGVMEGRIMDVCQEAGCWANIELPAGQVLKVLFRDATGDEFGIPKNASGKMIDVHGVAYMDTVSVEMQRHYLEDKKASPEEMAAVKQPKITPMFTADGAMVK